MNVMISAMNLSEDWLKQMEQVRDACRTAGVDLPEEVERFFNTYDEIGKGVQLTSEIRYQGDGEEHMVDMSEILSGTTHIRVLVYR